MDDVCSLAGEWVKSFPPPSVLPLAMRNAFAVTVATVLLSSIVFAQRGSPPADPLVRENATSKVAAHTYVIADNNVGLVPNVGIVVGTRATLVIDPGLGRRNGETVLREVAKTRPERVVEFLSPRLARVSGLTLREATKHLSRRHRLALGSPRAATRRGASVARRTKLREDPPRKR